MDSQEASRSSRVVLLVVLIVLTVLSAVALLHHRDFVMLVLLAFDVLVLITCWDSLAPKR